ncbi:MAG: hypothetical protein J3Q66DRAFT_372610 [Benniella sp.]|nr:MAG: hypothetical protein J3Q66DRAFT_372610 [Benniella sp.]
MTNIFSVFRSARKPETGSPQQPRPTLIQPFSSRSSFRSSSFSRRFSFSSSSSGPSPSSSRPSHFFSRTFSPSSRFSSSLATSLPPSPALVLAQASLLDSPTYYNALAMGKPHLYDPSINQLERTGLVLTDARSFVLDPKPRAPKSKSRS